MRALLCPASLKGVLTARDAVAALARGARSAGADVVELPIADGGEGTAEALHAALGGEWRQAIEMACGISLGLIAIAREGISFAVLRRMEDDEESAENALEEVREMVEDFDHEHETEPEAAREGAAVSR